MDKVQPEKKYYVQENKISRRRIKGKWNRSILMILYCPRQKRLCIKMPRDTGWSTYTFLFIKTGHGINNSSLINIEKDISGVNPNGERDYNNWNDKPHTKNIYKRLPRPRASRHRRSTVLHVAGWPTAPIEKGRTC
jgi:hypothetical protein